VEIELLILKWTGPGQEYANSLFLIQQNRSPYQASWVTRDTDNFGVMRTPEDRQVTPAVKRMAGTTGLEPAASAVTGQRSTKRGDSQLERSIWHSLVRQKENL